MARSVLAVLIGYLTFGISAGLLFGLTGQDPNVMPGLPFVVFSIAYGIGFAMLGGYLAATIAGRDALFHAGVVAGVIAMIAVASLLKRPEGSSAWSQIAALFLMAPAAFLGGLFRRRKTKIAGSSESLEPR